MGWPEIRFGFPPLLITKCFGNGWIAAACLCDEAPVVNGLSRMKGNFQVRFLEGGGLVTARFHSAGCHIPIVDSVGLPPSQGYGGTSRRGKWRVS